ncbi:MAG: 3-oxoacid CoA-transferase subunit B [Eubacteriales bacterium]
MGMAVRDKMAKRAAEEINNGDIVNLGFGIPQLSVQYIPKEKMVFFHAENGVLGSGPAAEKGKEDPDLVDPGCVPITIVPGGSYFDSATSFAIIRGGKLDLSVLGALEVAENGDLANWIVPGAIIPGMGGAMDLAKKAKKVIAIMTHTDKKGNPKIRVKCELPLTASKCVSLIITDLAVISVEPRGLVLKEIFDTTTVEEVISKTEAKLIVEEPVRVISYE